jgi:hypothetical protein
MKAITLWQPYATAVALGLKRFETRDWPTVYRGLLAIHAGTTTDTINPACVLRAEQELGPSRTWPKGAIVAITRLTALRQSPGHAIENWPEPELFYGNFKIGRWAWKLELLVNLNSQPVYCRGAQGLWSVPPGVNSLLIAACASLLEYKEHVRPVPRPILGRSLVREPWPAGIPEPPASPPKL